jgi:hypothetical protein
MRSPISVLPGSLIPAPAAITQGLAVDMEAPDVSVHLMVLWHAWDRCLQHPTPALPVNMLQDFVRSLASFNAH